MWGGGVMSAASVPVTLVGGGQAISTHLTPGIVAQRTSEDRGTVSATPHTKISP